MRPRALQRSAIGITLFLAIASATTFSAETMTVEGQVVDGKTGIAIPVEALADSGEIRLSPIGLGFREQVSVTARAPGDSKIFGHRYEGRGYGIGFGSAMLDSEIGARIKIKKPTFLESAHFTVAHTGGESFLYRVNIYDHAGKEIGDKLLREDVILAAVQARRPTCT